MTFPISPGVYPNIEDLSERAPNVATSIGAIVFASNRGSLSRKYMTDRTRFDSAYGLPDPRIGFGHDSGRAFLLEARSLWCKRVVGEQHRYSFGLYANNYYTGTTPFYEGTTFTALQGSAVSYDLVNRTVQDLVFDGDLVAGNVFDITLNDQTVPSVNFAQDNNTTLTAIAQALQSALDAEGAGGAAFVVSRDAPHHDQNRIVRIVSPENAEIIFADPLVTLGGSQAAAVVRDADWLFFVIAENPGVWANQVSTRITTIDVGIPQRIRFTFSRALVAGNNVTLTINGHTITQGFTSSNDATLTALAAAIQVAVPGARAAMRDSGLGGFSSGREITVVAPDSYADLTLGHLGVTGGVVQPLISYAEQVTSQRATNSFLLQVFEGTNLRVPQEIFNVKLDDAIDGFGNQMNIGYQVNHGPRVSSRIRVVMNDALPEEARKVIGVTHAAINTRAGFLGGGDNGNAVTSLQVVQGWNDFSDPEKVTIRLLINAGYSTPEVQQKMVLMCETRRDCFAILDIPADQQDPAMAVDYRNNEMNIDSKYAAAYTPNVLIFDDQTGKRRYIPPSGLVACQYAFTDRVTHEWFAPAGLNRGLIRNCLGLAFEYNEGDRDLLSLSQVNAIRKMQGRFPIWGEYTLQYRASALQSVPVVRLIITIEVALVDAVAYSVFEPNDPITRFRITRLCTDFLKPIQRARGLYDFIVICNDDNNPPPIIDARQLNVDLWLKPTLAALYIRLTSVISKTAGNFDEQIRIRNNEIGAAAA